MKVPGPDPRAAAGLQVQAAALAELLRPNEVVTAILERAPALALPGWYLGAGGIAQTVWNGLHGYPPRQSIKDYDLVYFDGDDLSEAGELAAARRVSDCFAGLDVVVDVTNEARVHLWYEQRFGVPCPAYTSTEHAVTTWPTTATAVAVRSVNGASTCAPRSDSMTCSP
jgi:hypothetical protein